jgi:hypothetical protein
MAVFIWHVVCMDFYITWYSCGCTDSKVIANVIFYFFVQENRKKGNTLFNAFMAEEKYLYYNAYTKNVYMLATCRLSLMRNTYEKKIRKIRSKRKKGTATVMITVSYYIIILLGVVPS